MQTTAVEANPYALPCVRPMHFAGRKVDVAGHLLVRVYTDGGVVGTADAPPAQTLHLRRDVDVDQLDDLGLLRPPDRRCRPARARDRARPPRPHRGRPGR